MSSPWGAQPPKLPSMDFNFNQLPKRAIGAGAAAVAVLVLLFSTAYTIDEGERGVILRLGKVVGEAGPGLHFKIPVINAVEKISVQIQKEAFEKTDAADTTAANLQPRPAAGHHRHGDQLSRHRCPRRSMPSMVRWPT
jgi:hypothetical protein